MKPIKTNRIFQIIYPIVVYFFVYQVGVSLLIQIIGEKYGTVLCLLIAGIICLIPIYTIYKRIPKLIPDDTVDSSVVVRYVLWILGVVALGIILNIILTHTPLVESSEGFKRASNTLTDGNLALMLLCNGIVIPVLEELLIRGIVVGQIYMWRGGLVAILASSICFGILHNNIVQFIYAVIVGIGLGLMYIKNKRLLLCIIAHGLINSIVIIYGYLGG